MFSFFMKLSCLYCPEETKVKTDKTDISSCKGLNSRKTNKTKIDG